MASKPYTPAPKHAVQFPPVRYRAAYRVQTGDNWWTLQKKYGLADVWDLIQFNFQTKNPDEVNWCLEKLVGCTETTPDRKNYRFSSSATPGLIYVPFTGGNKSGDLGDNTCDDGGPITGKKQRELNAVALVEVRNALTHLKVSNINIPWIGTYFPGTILDQVATCVYRGTVKVEYDHALCGMARYNVPSNTIFLGQGFVPCANFQQWGLIIHECVHAGMDVWKVKVTNADSEAMAYVAQMRYLQLCGVAKEAAILAVGDAALGEIYKVAWNIATQLQKNELTIDPTFCGLLRMKVLAHPLYREEDPGNPQPADYDGVKGAHFPGME